MRKRGLSLLLALVLALSLTACGGGAQSSAPADDAVDTASSAGAAVSSAAAEAQVAAESASESASAEPETSAETASAHSDTLVVVFSATGNTRGIAETIVGITGADFREIVPAQPYSEEDLNYNDSGSRATEEQNDPDVRPELGGEPISLEGYTTLYLGYPIWWGQEPRILDTFVESQSFDGITVIPFCTSGSSGIGNSAQTLEALAGSGTWLEGERFSAGASDEEVRNWIEGLNGV
jgi:flavodoxin